MTNNAAQNPIQKETHQDAYTNFSKKIPHRQVHPHSMNEIMGLRRGLITDLERLENSGYKTNAPLRSIRTPVGYFFGYDGVNDREQRVRIAKFWRTISPHLDYVSPYLEERKKKTSEKIRIGFFCQMFSHHTVGLLFYDLINTLDRNKFHVSIFTAQSRKNNETHNLYKQTADEFFYFPSSVGGAVKMVEKQKLDILFYPEIGMDPLTYLLAHARLAPVQCLSWGHPVTSGLPYMDYFISSKLIEPENAQEHYSEKLVLLEDLPTNLIRPKFYAKDKASRSHFHLPEKGNLYLCPQMLYKIHPDFDEYFKDILAADPKGHIVLIASSAKQKASMLEARFEKKFPEDIYKRIHLIDKIPNEEFIDFLSLGDVLLDPIHFGSGRSGYEAVFSGTPVVTHPMNFMRGRVMQGLYRKIGVTDMITSSKEEYVKTAVRCANDPAFRSDIAKRLQEKIDVVFDTNRSFLEIQNFFEKAVSAARINKPLVDWA